VNRAKALVFGTPVYKSVYSGGLKAIIDVIDVKALAGKPLLAIAAGRFEAHAATMDDAFQALYRSFGDSVVALPSLFLLDSQIRVTDGGVTLDAAAERALQAAQQRLELQLRAG
jgi:FMN reductase